MSNESDPAYYWFLFFISDMHKTVTQMSEDAEDQREISEKAGDTRFIPSEGTLKRWSAQHAWKRRRAVYNKIQMEDMKEIIHKGRVVEMERFFGNRE